MEIDLGKIKITWKGLYSSEIPYEKDDAVFFSGSSYINKSVNSLGIPPLNGGNNSTWDLMASGSPTMTNRGDIIFNGEFGPESLSAGIAGQTLITNGPNLDPEWGSPPTRQDNLVAKLPEGNTAAAYRSGAVIMGDGTIACWGHGANATLGQGTNQSNRFTPINPNFPVTDLNVEKLIRVGNSNWALMSDGSVYYWGINSFGQGGLGSTSIVHSPTKISALDGVNIVSISVGTSNSVNDNHVLMLDDTGTVWVMGDNTDGQLGVGNTTNLNIPTALAKNDFVDVLSVGSGNGCSFGIDTSGNLWSWGRGASGLLGLGSESNQTSPIQVNLPGAVIQVSSTLNRYSSNADWRGHTLVLLQDGRVFSSGFNNYGQLGLGNTQTFTSFQEITSLGNDNKSVHTCGGFHGTSVVVKEDLTIRTFGYSTYGQCGSGQLNVVHITPYHPEEITGVVKVLPYGNLQYTGIALLRESGVVSVSGYNAHGQLAVGHSNHVSTFQNVKFMKDSIKDICTVGCNNNEVSLGFLTKNGLYYQSGYAAEWQLPDLSGNSSTTAFRVRF